MGVTIVLVGATLLNLVVAIEGGLVTHAPAITSTSARATAALPSSETSRNAQSAAHPSTEAAGKDKTAEAKAPAVAEPGKPAATLSPLPHHVRAFGESDDVAELAPATRDNLVWLRFASVEIALVVIAILAFGWPKISLRPTTPTAVIVSVTQVVLIVGGVIGAVLHASWVAPDSSGHYVPNLDVTTLGWCVLIIIGALLPRLQKIGFAGAELEITAEKATSVTNDIGSLMENWIGALNRLVTWLETDESPSTTIFNFLRDRADEALEQMALPGEYLRSSFWSYDEELGGLKLLQSNQIHDPETLEKVFRIGKDASVWHFARTGGGMWRTRDR